MSGVDVNTAAYAGNWSLPAISKEDLEVTGRAGCRCLRRYDLRADRGGNNSRLIKRVVADARRLQEQYPEDYESRDDDKYNYRYRGAWQWMSFGCIHQSNPEPFQEENLIVTS
jgi:hypothetical protein